MSCSVKGVAGWEVGKDEGVGNIFGYPPVSPCPDICQKMAACATDHSKGDVCAQFHTQLSVLPLPSSLSATALVSIKVT